MSLNGIVCVVRNFIVTLKKHIDSSVRLPCEPKAPSRTICKVGQREMMHNDNLWNANEAENYLLLLLDSIEWMREAEDEIKHLLQI
jgi:hypothetical protein